MRLLITGIVGKVLIFPATRTKDEGSRTLLPAVAMVEVVVEEVVEAGVGVVGLLDMRQPGPVIGCHYREAHPRRTLTSTTDLQVNVAEE